MTVAKRFWAALAAVKRELVQAPQVGPTGRGKRFACCVVFSLALAAFGALAAPALAEPVRVRGQADAGLPQVQARQQALERALAEAVFAEARRLLAGPISEPRLEALRAHLASKYLEFIHTYQEVPATKATQETHVASAPTNAQNSPHAAVLELEADVEVNRPYLRLTLVRLGFFTETRPVAYALRLGHGVTEKDAKALEPSDLLLGLAQGQQSLTGAVPEASVERLPQGYYKAMLRHGAKALAVDASGLPELWLGVWGKYFEEAQRQSGPGMQRLTIAGFAGVDAALEFLQIMTTWDEAVQEPKLAIIEMDGATVKVQYVCRVISQQALEARLGGALGARKLTLASQAGLSAP